MTISGVVVYGQGLFAGRHFITPVMQPGCGWTDRRAQWEWLLYTRICRWYCYPNQQKIFKHCLRASSGGFEYGTTVMWQNSAINQSTKDGDSAIQKETRFKGPKGTNHLWTWTAAATKVKYLGFILDKGLTWKAQLENAMIKAYRAFWTCQGTFGKTWGLKTNLLNWIHTMVIRPTLTYGSMVR